MMQQRFVIKEKKLYIELIKESVFRTAKKSVREKKKKNLHDEAIALTCSHLAYGSESNIRPLSETTRTSASSRRVPCS